jgi:polyhydroxyalkanoate synthesis regulator phasin
MCIICVELEKGRMTAKEARRALGEMVRDIGSRHAEEVERAVSEAEKKAPSSQRQP